MEKSTELRDPDSCLNRAAPDEPLFVLRAKDSLAPQAIRLWCAMAHHTHEAHEIDEALNLADRMQKWRDSQPVEVANPTPVRDALARATGQR